MKYLEIISSKLKELNLEPTEFAIVVSVAEQKLTLLRGGQREDVLLQLE